MLFFLYPRFENGRINPGVCGAEFIMAGRNRLACFGARDKGTCDNHLTIRRDESRRGG